MKTITIKLYLNNKEAVEFKKIPKDNRDLIKRRITLNAYLVLKESVPSVLSHVKLNLLQPIKRMQINENATNRQ